MSLFPVATTRASNQLLEQRLLAQVQFDQLDLLRLQDQISTGRKISVPSEDSIAAGRAIGLQRLIEQKEQVQLNLNTSESFLAATDTAVTDVSRLLIDIRGAALEVAGTTSTEEQRAATSEQIKRAIEQIQNAANKQFRGRYLFAGSKTTQPPFVTDSTFIRFDGNKTELRSYADIDLLLPTNVDGDALLGAFSPEVKGDVDLNPVITESTRLSDLRGGIGITNGSVELSDGNSTTIVDLSSSETLRDVILRLESNAPTGRKITARVEGDHLRVDIDAAGGGNFTIREIGGGTTAAELGILEEIGSGTTPVIGGDLDPILRLTTPLADILGIRSSVIVDGSGANNSLRLESVQRGTAFNGTRLQFVDDDALQAAPGLLASNETAIYSTTAVAARGALTLAGLNNNLILTSATPGADFNNVTFRVVDGGAIGNAATVNYNSATKELTLGIDNTGATQTQTLINAINAEGTFTATYDASDASDGGFVPIASVPALNAGITTGTTSNSGGAANTIFVNVQAGASTAETVVNAFANSAVADLFTLTIDGKDTSSSSQAGLGLIDLSAKGATAGGSGIEFDQQSGIQIVNGGTSHTITFTDAETVEDLLNKLNGSAANILATINESQTGINIQSRLSGSNFHIGENGGATAAQLGLRSLDRDTALRDLNHGFGVNTADGIDFFVTRRDGVELSFDISAAVTIGDVIDIINNHPSNTNPADQVVARLAKFGNGIELVDDNNSGGGNLSIRSASLAANDLGLIPVGERTISSVDLGTTAAAASALVQFTSPNQLNTGFQITANTPGEAFDDLPIEFRDTLTGNSAAVTVDLAQSRIYVDYDAGVTDANAVVTAFNAEGTFAAVLDTVNDPSNDGSGTIPVIGVAAISDGGVSESILADDANPLEVKGVFNSLIRLNEAVANYDLPQIERAIAMLDDDFQTINFARSEVGARQQSIDVLRSRLDSEEIELKKTLSLEIDVDLTEAISNMLQRQAAFQASLQLVGKTFQLTLLDFI